MPICNGSRDYHSCYFVTYFFTRLIAENTLPALIITTDKMNYQFDKQVDQIIKEHAFFVDL